MSTKKLLFLNKRPGRLIGHLRYLGRIKISFSQTLKFSSKISTEKALHYFFRPLFQLLKKCHCHCICPVTEATNVLKNFEKLFGNILDMRVVIVLEKFSTTNSRKYGNFRSSHLSGYIWVVAFVFILITLIIFIIIIVDIF